MALILDPFSFALEITTALGINFDDIYNDRGGIRRAQLLAINKLNASTNVKVNAYKTIKRLDASPNSKVLDYGKNLKNTIRGTLQSALMDSLDSLPKPEQRQVKIRWIPSSADEQDPIHALSYGKTMTLDVAIKRGLGVRYGCQCAMEILSGEDIIRGHMKNFKSKSIK